MRVRYLFGFPIHKGKLVREAMNCQIFKEMNATKWKIVDEVSFVERGNESL